jgi:prepilin-type N-terminal cleavage/methylation domain-containing protein
MVFSLIYFLFFQLLGIIRVRIYPEEEKMNKQDGFTLLELIVVLAILGIILSIAVPNYLGIHENADDSAQEVQAGLIAKSLKQEFADDFATVDESSDKLNVDIGGTSTSVQGFKVCDTAPERGHLCFSYIKDTDTIVYPYFAYTLDKTNNILSIKHVKSAEDVIADLPAAATVNYY